MTTFALIHGGSGSAWAFRPLVKELQNRGHDAIAVDLPIEDPDAELWDWAHVVSETVAERLDVAVVAHSLGGFIGPLTCELIQARSLTLVSGMIPAAGESFHDWFRATGHDSVHTPDDDIAMFLHDVDPELAAEALARSREHAAAPLKQPWPMESWPEVRTEYVLCRQDRCFPADWTRDHVKARLGITPHEIDSSHTPHLSRPAELAELLIDIA